MNISPRILPYPSPYPFPIPIPIPYKGLGKVIRRLLKKIKRRIKPPTVEEKIHRLKKLQEDGTITKEQYKKAVEALLNHYAKKAVR